MRNKSACRTKDQTRAVRVLREDDRLQRGLAVKTFITSSRRGTDLDTETGDAVSLMLHTSF